MECYYINIGLIAIISTVYLFFKWKYSYWKNRGVPTLPPSIPYGNFQGVSKSIALKDLLINVYQTFKNKSPIAGIYMIFSPMAVLTDLDLIRDILIRDFNVFHDRGLYYNEKDDPLSAHLVSLDGQKWKSVRQKLTPTFTSGKMKFMFSTVVDVSDRFMATLKEETRSSSSLEMKDLLARFTTDVIGECAFGLECNSLKDHNTEFRKYARVAMAKPRHSRMTMIFLNEFPNLGRKLGVKVNRDDVAAFFRGVVYDTVEHREKNGIRRNDFVDLLIDIKNGKGDGEFGSLTMDEIAAQGFVFFFAGFETSSTTLSYILYELALNQNIQEKAREEIIRVLKKHNGQFTYEAMMDMHYIDQIINETLRKYPVAPTIGRIASNHYKVSNTKIVLEKNTKIFVPIYAIHHDPTIYPDAEVFDPDRFSPEEVKKRHPMSFLPFGDGPRSCIGLRFGRMQAKIGLINLLRNFHVEKSPKTAIPLKFVARSNLLTTEGGMHLCLENILK